MTESIDPALGRVYRCRDGHPMNLDGPNDERYYCPVCRVVYDRVSALEAEIDRLRDRLEKSQKNQDD